jgi:CHAT domain-containing protein
MGCGALVLLAALVCLDSPAQTGDAQSHFDAAQQLRKKHDAGSVRQAIAEYQKAAGLWLGAHDPAHAAGALNAAAQLELAHADYAAATMAFEQALAEDREARNAAGEGDALYGLSRVYLATGDNRKAIDTGEQALAIRRTLGDKAGQGFILQNLGWAYFSVGEAAKSLASYQAALAIRTELKDEFGIGLADYGIGSVYWAWGESEKALNAYQEALPHFRAAKYEGGVANMLNSAGLAYADIGEYDKAIENYRRAQAVWEKLKEPAGEVLTLNNLGLAYAGLHDPVKAISFYERALPLAGGPDTRARAYILQNMGDAHAELQQYDKAVGYYDQSLDLKRKSGDRFGQAYTLTRLGEVQLALGAPSKALGTLGEALQLDRFVGARGGEASTLAATARASAALDRLDRAQREMQSAIDIIEGLRTDLSSRDLQTTFFANQQAYYTFYIGLLMRLDRLHPKAGYDREALQISEQSRARTLLETLAEGRAGIRSGVDPELLNRQHQLENDLHARARQIESLASGHASETQLQAARNAFDDTLRNYNAIEAAIRSSSPHYASLLEPEPLTASDIQHDVLDPGTLLLEYSLGRDRSYAWLVSQDRLWTAVLPRRDRIDALVGRLYRALNARNVNPPNESIEQERVRVMDADADFARNARELSRILLAPLAAHFGGKRLVIVPDGALHYVPFAALPLGPGGKPAVMSDEIVRLPSASMMEALRREEAHRRRATTIAIVADPVFDTNDARLRREGASTSLVSASQPEMGVQYPRLRFSRTEADEIASLAGSAKVKLISDFAANRDAFLDGALSNERILHIATHTVIDNAHPALSRIVLSRVDARGRPRDGYLRLFEIYNLHLNADLVVLSACRTALGKEIRGEGLVGLTRGFLYAGASRVVASLWSVQDRATAELMRRFYGHILRGGLSPADALCAAQREMASDSRWSNPYYWAAFTLQGDWK